MDGTTLRQLTDFGQILGHEVVSGDWSPDGRSLISASPNGKLVIVDAHGHGIRRIDVHVGASEYFAFAPTFSPDGRRVTFAMATTGNPDIYTARRDGTDVPAGATDGVTGVRCG